MHSGGSYMTAQKVSILIFAAPEQVDTIGSQVSEYQLSESMVSSSGDHSISVFLSQLYVI